MVCDWSHPPQLSEDTLALHPRCVHGVTCPGHHADDLLPFKWLVRDDKGLSTSDGRLTNTQFYGLISPTLDHLPYVYDKLTSWPACDGGVMSPTGGSRR